MNHSKEDSNKAPPAASVVPFFTSRLSRFKEQDPLDKIRMNLRSKSLIPGKTKIVVKSCRDMSQSTSVDQPNVSVENDKLTRMKLRKEAKKDRAKRKERTVITDGDLENYDIDKVLRKLGEVSNKIESHL